MARIDVSELMVDPDFINSFTIVRRTTTVNQYGENVLAETEESSFGSVQGIGKDALKRLPDGVQLSSMKTIYTKAVFKADEAGKYSDQIIWDSERYNIITVLPWGNFGSGWYEVDVELQKASL